MDDALRQEIENELSFKRCRRKADQAWDMAGLARQDGDANDALRRTEEARAWGIRASELLSLIKSGQI